MVETVQGAPGAAADVLLAPRPGCDDRRSRLFYQDFLRLPHFIEKGKHGAPCDTAALHDAFEQRFTVPFVFPFSYACYDAAHGMDADGVAGLFLKDNCARVTQQVMCHICSCPYP